MTHDDTVSTHPLAGSPPPVRVIRHKEVRKKLDVSSAKLFDMMAKKQFPRPFTIVPGGRAVGWLEGDVDAWILDRKARLEAAE